MSYELVHKPTFANQLLAIPGNQLAQILKKIELLRESPEPDAKSKKRLVGYKGGVFRIRSGDYRILYSFDPAARWVALLGVDDRKDVYKGTELIADGLSVDIGNLSGADDLLSVELAPARQPAPPKTDGASADWLPRKLDPAFLDGLQIDRQWFAALRACETFDDLAVADVPDLLRDRLFDVLTNPNLDRVLQQPSFETGGVDDLLLFHEGKLVDFLLKLDPDQERYVTWALDGSGPTLVKGGPGSGKSTIALYRAKALVEGEKQRGNPAPRILFTTYTNALVTSSQQLIRRLLGPDAGAVEVRTADSLVMEIVTAVDGKPHLLEARDRLQVLDEAIKGAKFEGDALQRRVRLRAIEGLSREYLLEEIEKVIIARGLSSLDAYLAAPRAGRHVPLNASQRSTVWSVYESFERALHRRRMTTWEQLRRRVAQIVQTDPRLRHYDGVIIDEAQDLDPNALRFLVSLAKSPDRIFCTADANQSIYASGFRWSDVHEDLQFRGRTGVLRRIYRSTREIGTAAASYLAEAEIDPDEDTRYVVSGPLPVVRSVAGAEHEADLIAHFLELARKEFRLNVGACAVLVPSEAAGNAIAERLRNRGLSALFMSGRTLDLDQPCVKVLTLKSVKGLEFPIVAVAGFQNGFIPGPAKGAPRDEATELLQVERRTIFVALTRAMRALLLVTPAATQSPLLQGFPAGQWNTGPRA